jgi:hypothetical protein
MKTTVKGLATAQGKAVYYALTVYAAQRYTSVHGLCQKVSYRYVAKSYS